MRRGFTLAEVIITVGIIGVIATMVMPVLTKSIQSTQRRAQVKAVYNKLNSAYQLAVQEAGYPIQCGYWGNGSPYSYELKSDVGENGEKIFYYIDNNGERQAAQDHIFNGRFNHCQDLGERMIKNLRVAKICENGGLEGGCFPKAYKGSETYTGTMNSCNGLEGAELEKCATTATSGVPFLRSSNLNNKDYVVVLNDGTILFSISDNHFNPRGFAVDVNGNKGPNRFGYDIFTFRSEYAPDNKTIKLYGTMWEPRERGAEWAYHILNDREDETD